MKFLTGKKFQIILIIALNILLAQVSSNKMKQLSDFGTDPELESLLKGSELEEDNNNNSENMFEDLNFLENRNLIRNATNPTPAGKNSSSPIVDLTQKNIDFSGWFAVSNIHFNDPEYFPIGTKATKKEVDFSNLQGNNPSTSM